MGGLAIGSYLTSRLIPRIQNPLMLYAVIEVVIGVFALFFHEIFIFSNDFLFNRLASNIESGFIFTGLKWLIGILLILPQSILLGSTFPLISSGLLKYSPHQSGKKISLLYFNNSFGAAIGALVSGFFLIQQFGLPGTILTAGLINILIGLAVFLIIRKTSVAKEKQKPFQPINKDRFYYLLLGTAFFTGLASFFYEIAWIRMLTLVLGATTHAFELMLSAFILGLALGSLWIKKRIDTFKSPVTILAYVQILMASFAFLTLFSYDSLFDIMEYVFKSLKKTEQGYSFYILINHFLSLIIMLPATIFAGMTLPLVTHILFKQKGNEKVIGQVYAINTLGAISGVVIAMNILLPLTGTKGLVSLGGLVDLVIGLSLFGYLYYKNTNRKLQLQFILACLFSFSIFQITYFSASFEPHKTASGVFRTGIASLSDKTKLLFHKDGKLSTVDVFQGEKGNISISNNGKPDAAINVYSSKGSADEVTMIIAGILPFAINPEIEYVANIGMGSGQTAQALLSYKTIKQVDTIEIEKSVIEALPLFEVYSQLVRYDERSNIIINDAKTFFSSSQKKYDSIFSEPPNLWVNGVASLFTTEFYSQVKNKLSPNGFFAQWIHLYEIDTKTVASILKTISNNFDNYSIYNTDDSNIIILASDNSNLRNIDNRFLSNNKALKLLSRIQINSSDSFYARHIGNKKLLDPLLNSYNTKVASDYYPTLTYDAAKSLFLKNDAISFTSFHSYPIPINQILMGSFPIETFNVQNEVYFQKSRDINTAKNILNDILNEPNNKQFNHKRYGHNLSYSLKLFSSQLFHCSIKSDSDDGIIIKTAYELAVATTPYLGKNDLTKLWNKVHNTPCYKSLNGITRSWLKLHSEIATQDFKGALGSSTQLLDSRSHYGIKKLNEYLFSSILISAVKTKNNELAQQVWKKHANKLFKSAQDVPYSLRLLHSHIKN